jgi:hypothetical protein
LRHKAAEVLAATPASSARRVIPSAPIPQAWLLLCRHTSFTVKLWKQECGLSQPRAFGAYQPLN